MSLAAMLQELIDSGLSQTEISNLTEGKVRQSAISKILSGQIKNVWSDKADAISLVYWNYKRQQTKPEVRDEA